MHGDGRGSRGHAGAGKARRTSEGALAARAEAVDGQYHA